MYEGSPLASHDLPGLAGEVVPRSLLPDPGVAPPNASLRAVLGISMPNLHEYITNVKVAERGFAVLVANDAKGVPRAIAYRNPKALVRFIPFDPVQGVNVTFADTADLPDPELKACSPPRPPPPSPPPTSPPLKRTLTRGRGAQAFMERLPPDLAAVPLPPRLASAAFDPSAGFMQASPRRPRPRSPPHPRDRIGSNPIASQEADFEVGGREYAGRWRKLIGEASACGDCALHLVLGVAAPRAELRSDVETLQARPDPPEISDSIFGFHPPPNPLSGFFPPLPPPPSLLGPSPAPRPLAWP
eukprot:tig00021036_g17321.t1